MPLNTAAAHRPHSAGPPPDHGAVVGRRSTTRSVTPISRMRGPIRTGWQRSRLDGWSPRTRPGARPGDRLRGRREPDGDGRPRPRHRGARCRSRRRADRGGSAPRRGDRAGKRDVASRRVRELAGGALGEFDYIVAHGVYGWIPQDANDALLAPVRRASRPPACLRLHNVQPGGYFRRMLRDAAWRMRERSLRRSSGRRRRRSCTRFLEAAADDAADTYGALLEREPAACRRPAVPPRPRRPSETRSRSASPSSPRMPPATACPTSASRISSVSARRRSRRASSRGVAARRRDRIASRTYTDLLTARHFRKSVLCRAGPVKPQPGARAQGAAALGGVPECGSAEGRPGQRRVRRA